MRARPNDLPSRGIRGAVSYSLYFLAASAAFRSAPAQQEPAAIVAKSADNAATGNPARWDFGGTDLTFKAQKNEVWILDTYSSAVTIVNKFQAGNLAANPTQTVINLPAEFAQAPVLGIAEITNGAFQGKNLILIDPTFGTSSAPSPQLGIYEDDGNLVAGETFVPITNLDPNVLLSSIDFNPVREEIAAYDMKNHAFYILDSTFAVILGPVPLLGSPNGFVDIWFFGSVDREGLRGAGCGIAYTGPDSLLVSSGFYNFWETHLLLEYDLAAGGAFANRAIDLSVARSTGLNPDIAFVGLDTGKVGAEDIVFTHNFGDDSLYAFTQTLGTNPAPVELTACGTIADTGSYGIAWNLPVGAAIDSIRIYENSVEVATLGPADVQYISPLPLLGKAFLEVVTEAGGIQSGVRSVCQVENTGLPETPGSQFAALQVDSLGAVLSGIAVTKTPATPDAFRGYLIGQLSNDVEVFDYQFNVIPQESLTLSPRVTTRGSNLAAIGVALFKIDGKDHLAVLDPDGPLDNNVPSAIIYGLEGATRGQQVKQFDPIDLSLVSPAPFLFDWDTTPDNQFVAGGIAIETNEPVIVRLIVTGDTMLATQVSPVPQRLLTPFSTSPVTGIGVSALPSGYLLVAGSDTFSRTYTEALLMTPFVDGVEGGAEPALPKFVGYAQGQLLANEFGAPFDGLGPGIGPDTIFGFDTAFFDLGAGADPSGVGVSYLPTGLISLITNPSAGQVLQSQGQLLFQGTNACSRPDLVAEQLVDAIVDIPAGQKGGTASLTPTFTAAAGNVDYFLYVINQSTTDPARLTLEVKLDGAVNPQASQSVVLPAGRYYRRQISTQAVVSLQVSATNSDASAAQIRFITGAMASGTSGPGITNFRRGDIDGNGILNITDAISGLNWLFKGGTIPACVDAADADDDGKAGLTDMVVLVNHLFKAGPAPAAPGPIDCGPDPVNDDLAPCVYTCQ